MRVLFLIILAIVSVISLDTIVFAQEETLAVEAEYSDLRREYRELVIKDAEKGDSDLLKKLVAKINQFIERNSENRVFLPRALYLKGRLLEEKNISESKKVFEDLVSEYPGDDLADDSLLALSRIYRRQGDMTASESALRKIASDYPSSDSFLHADLELGSFKKASEISTANKQNITDSRSIETLQNNYPVIVLDPGHGGSEDGAKGPEGVLEKNIVLAITQQVKAELLNNSKLRVVMTREDDSLVALSERTKLANDAGGEIFVSIHANASDHKTGKGIETYYLDNTDDKSSLRLAERENFIEGANKTDLSFIVSDFIQGVKMDDSITLAHLVQRHLYQNLATKFDNVKNLGVKRAPFYVLVGAHMPCILVEVSFIDHPVEGRRLMSERYQKGIATGISEAIKVYLKKKGKIS